MATMVWPTHCFWKLECYRRDYAMADYENIVTLAVNLL